MSYVIFMVRSDFVKNGNEMNIDWQWKSDLDGAKKHETKDSVSKSLIEVVLTNMKQGTYEIS